MTSSPPVSDPAAQDLARMRECPACGAFQAMPALPIGGAAECWRCQTTLRRRRPDSLNRVLAYTLAASCLLSLALGVPFLTIDAAGRLNATDLFTGPGQLASDGLGILGGVVLGFTVIVPAVQLALTLAVLLGLRVQHPPASLPLLYGLLARLKPWSMIEVYLIGVFVAYTRLTAIAQVHVGPGLYALAGVMLAMVAADGAADPDAVWEAMEQRGLRLGAPLNSGPDLIGCDCCGLVHRAQPGLACPRCGRRLRWRKPDSLRRTAALLLAATILYVPANIYPVLTLTRFGRGAPSTILEGVRELAAADMWPLALLVFGASISVPVLKLIGLCWMLIATTRRSGARLRVRTRLYHAVEVIGRWSMIDVFMISILVALVHLGFLANVEPNSGAASFAGVVILTMLASASFDPRLMWDAAR